MVNTIDRPTVETSVETPVAIPVATAVPDAQPIGEKRVTLRGLDLGSVSNHFARIAPVSGGTTDLRSRRIGDFCAVRES